MAKKILITGTHSTGKSTLCDHLQKLEYFKDFKFIGGVTREAKSYGLDINESGDELTQLYCMSKDFLNLVQNQDQKVVFDRSILDTMIYTQYLTNIEDWVLTTMTELCSRMIGEFDLILWLRPEIEIEDDNVRSTNPEFQSEIDLLFEYYFGLHFDLPVHVLSGSVEHRISQIEKILEDEVR